MLGTFYYLNLPIWKYNAIFEGIFNYMNIIFEGIAILGAVVNAEMQKKL